jgi:hypothetical protein
MVAVLRVETGALEGLALVLRPGESATVGRRAGLSIPDDTAMSMEHFAIEWAADGKIFLRDLGSTNGSFVNGARVGASGLSEADRVDAGRTGFSLSFRDTGPGLEHAGVLKALEAYGSSLYAVLDAARDSHVLALLRESYAEYKSLYDGKSAETLADCAPYLTQPATDPVLLESLVTEGWGKSWGVYLTCGLPLDEVRKHLRKFLMVQVEERSMYFRYYDPRVLRMFLPTCTAVESREFFGPVDAYFVEGEDGNRMLCLRPTRRDCLTLGSAPAGALR